MKLADLVKGKTGQSGFANAIHANSANPSVKCGLKLAGLATLALANRETAEAIAAKYGRTLAEAEAALDTGYSEDWADLITRPKSLEAHIRWFVENGRGVNR